MYTDSALQRFFRGRSLSCPRAESRDAEELFAELFEAEINQ